MTDIDDCCAFGVTSCGFIDSTFALLLKIHLRFRGSFLRFHIMADGPYNGLQIRGRLSVPSSVPSSRRFLDRPLLRHLPIRYVPVLRILLIYASRG